MNKVNMTEHDNDTVRKFVGIDKFKVNTKLDKIAERVVKAYNKQLPVNASREQLELGKRIELLQPIISYVYDDDLDDVNELIFDYVADNFENLQEYLVLNADECIAINRREYNSRIVYKVVDLFAGAGGLSLGFMQTKKFDIKVAFENNTPIMQKLCIFLFDGLWNQYIE